MDVMTLASRKAPVGTAMQEDQRRESIPEWRLSAVAVYSRMDVNGRRAVRMLGESAGTGQGGNQLPQVAWKEKKRGLEAPVIGSRSGVVAFEGGLHSIVLAMSHRPPPLRSCACATLSASTVGCRKETEAEVRATRDAVHSGVSLLLPVLADMFLQHRLVTLGECNGDQLNLYAAANAQLRVLSPNFGAWQWRFQRGVR